MTNELNPTPGPSDTAAAPSTSITASPPAAPKPNAKGLPTWMLQVDLILLLLLLVLSFFLASFTATNADLWMNLAIGKRLSEGQFQFGVDPFSWATEATETAPAVYWVHHGWLTSWLFYQLYVLLGGTGLVVAKAIVFTATIALLSRIGWKESNRWFVVICLAIATLALSPRLILQPAIVSYFFIAIALYILDRAGLFALAAADTKQGCTRCLWCLPPLFALWANLDQWFILGPLLLLLCCVGTALAAWFGSPRPIPLGRLVVVFGVSLLACVVNPHHVRVFQMPPELAYLALSLRLPLPNEVAGGGRTLQMLRQADPDARAFTWTVASVSSQYWGNPLIGRNIAGIAFFPLVILGLLAFTLTAMIRPQPGSPTFHIQRFVVWLLFALMALASYRMIAFFVLVAAPITAMTLGEFMLWQNVQADIPALRQDRGLRLARMFSLPFMLLLLFLAWPGWLHGTTDFRFNSPRHVAWEVRPDGSYKEAAESLRRLKEENACGNVFNMSLELPGYCAWFAPDVKCCFDARFALYPGRVDVFLQTRQAVLDPVDRQAKLRELFTQNKIDQVVLGAITTSERDSLFYWWLAADQWRARHADVRARVFSWAGPGRRWPVDSGLADMDRQAFGAVPPEALPPKDGTMQPPQLDLWDLYLQGVEPQPAAATEADLLHKRFMVANEFFAGYARPCSLIASCASIADFQAMPGGAIHAALVPLLHECNLVGLRPRPKEGEQPKQDNAPRLTWSLMKPVDFGPPAMPILMMRAARRAVAENSQDPMSHQSLLSACETVWRLQENYWLRQQSGAAPASLRERMRQAQINAGMYAATLLPPQRSDSAFQSHNRLAQHYLRLNLLDLAVDHLHEAERALELWRASGEKKAPKDADVRDYREQVQVWQKKVQLRLANWQENTAKMKTPFEKAVYAFGGPYQEARGEQMVETKLGLAKKALEILGTIPTSTLKSNEFNAYFSLSSDLLFQMGRVNDVARTLRDEEFRKRMPPALIASYEAIAGGVLGDYEMMDRGLPVLEKLHGEAARSYRAMWLSSLLAPPTLHSATAVSVATTLRTLPYGPVANMYIQYGERFNAMTLRGIAALESGDTKTARAIFHQAMAESGNAFGFSERPIAQRYRNLLGAQR